jgi:hypothetical protein
MNIIPATGGKKNSEKAENNAFEYAKLHNATLRIACAANPRPEEERRNRQRRTWNSSHG